MKVVFGNPPQSEVEINQIDLTVWRRLKEPQNFLWALIFSLPIAVFLLVFQVLYFNSSLVDYQFGFDIERIELSISFLQIAVGVATLFFMMIIHECLHLILIPGFYKSDKTIMGIMGYGAYVITSEEISVSRFYLISVFPYLIISIICPIVVSRLGLLSNLWVMLFILNAAASCIDILNLVITMFQVPRGAMITMRGMKTYFQP